MSLPYLRLLPPGFSCVTTITMSFLSNQHPVNYLPIDYAKRAGRSKFHFVQGRLPLHPAGAADGHVLQPAQGADAGRARPDGGHGAKLVFDLVVHHFRVTGSTVLVGLAAFNIMAIALLADLVVRRTSAE